MAKLIVKKFGGTSVGSLERIRAVAAQIKQSTHAGERLVIVVSAMSGETDRLLNLAYHLCPQPEPRELAALMTVGEQVSMSLLAMLLCSQGLRAKSYNASQLSITTDCAHTKARILRIDSAKIQHALQDNEIVIVAGFQGISTEGEVTALGRGGSDTSAVALAAALQADECQIYTDVDGIYTADPRMVPHAKRLDSIDFSAMLELANLGSKVLQWRSVALAGKYRIPVRVLSSFKSGPGTLINYMDTALEAPQFVGISHQLDLTRWVITLPHFAGDELAQLASFLAENNINIENINQMLIENTAKLCVLLNHEENLKATHLLQEFLQAKHWAFAQEKNLGRIALVGIGMRSHAWIAAKFLQTLVAEKIKPEDIIYSDLALSMVIPSITVTQVAQALHREFFEVK